MISQYGHADHCLRRDRPGRKCPSCQHWIYTRRQERLSDRRLAARRFDLVETTIRRRRCPPLPLDNYGLSGVLKRIYGAQYRFQTYRLKLEAKEQEGLQIRRFWLGRRDRPEWKRIAESYGGVLGEDPIHQLMYRNNPFFALIPKQRATGARS